jgi:nucleoid-associated protein YgaU
MRVEDGVSVITVQPGFTLWGIAEANFGDGIAYVQIFQENRENIRDPDLIFPGQIFQLPDLPRDRGRALGAGARVALVMARPAA